MMAGAGHIGRRADFDVRDPFESVPRYLTADQRCKYLSSLSGKSSMPPWKAMATMFLTLDSAVAWSYFGCQGLSSVGKQLLRTQSRTPSVHAKSSADGARKASGTSRFVSETRRLDRRSVLTAGAALATLAAAPTSPANAWCGTGYPSWAYVLKWTQFPAGPFTYNGINGTVFYRVLGEYAREIQAGVPPVFVFGTPGIGYNYFENFEALCKTDRRVVEIVFAGTSAGKLDRKLMSPDSCAEQIRAVARIMNVTTAHVVAHGSSALAALRVAASQSTSGENFKMRSLTLVSPYGSLQDLRNVNLATANSISEVAFRLMGTNNSRAIKTCVGEARNRSTGPLLLTYLTTASESLSGAALGQRLGALGRLPITLVTGGDEDIVKTDGWDAATLPANVVRKTYNAGHLAFVDDAVPFFDDLVANYDKLDDKVTANNTMPSDIKGEFRPSFIR